MRTHSSTRARPDNKMGQKPIYKLRPQMTSPQNKVRKNSANAKRRRRDKLEIS